MTDRLTTERRQQIFSAALRLMSEHGYDRVTMEQIAKHSRASTATLYRHWGSKTALVVEALRCMDEGEGQISVDTGSLIGDLHELVEQATDGTDDLMEIVGALQFAANRDPEISEAFREGINQYIGSVLNGLVERAVSRGELAADQAAIPYLQVLLLAPGVLEPLVRGIDVRGMHAYIDAVIAPALGLDTPTPTSRRK